jgi:hypothetical protein
MGSLEWTLTCIPNYVKETAKHVRESEIENELEGELAEFLEAEIAEYYKT